MATRRSFMMSGVSAAGALSFSGKAAAQRQSAGKRVEQGFTVHGCPGTVRIELTNNDSVINQPTITVRTPGDHLGLIDIHAPLPDNTEIRSFSVEIAVPIRDIQRVWYTQQEGGLGWNTFISLPWGAKIPAAGNEGSLVAAVENRYGANRGFIAFRDQSGDGSVEFRTDYFLDKTNRSWVHLVLRRFSPDGIFRTNGI